MTFEIERVKTGQRRSNVAKVFRFHRSFLRRTLLHSNGVYALLLWELRYRGCVLLKNVLGFGTYVARPRGWDTVSQEPLRSYMLLSEILMRQGTR